MARVLVVGAYIMGLGAIRSLHLKDIDAVSLHYEDTDIAHLSRYVSERVRVPHPGKAEKEFIDFLAGNSRRWRGSLILATDDHAAVAIARNKDVLSQDYVVGSPDWEAVQVFIEKSETYKLADACGVPYPQSFYPEDLQQLRNVEQQLAYPCILKPVKGHEFKHIFNTKNFEVRNAIELFEKFELCLKWGQSVMVQEIIPGPDTNIYKMQGYVNPKGRIVGKFYLKKLRSNPPPFGVGRVVVSKKRNQEVDDYTERLLAHAGFESGFFSMEFKKHSTDNKLKLMENNIRMVRNNWLATSCGVNYPWLIYMDLVEDQQIDTQDYKKDFYWIEFYSDVLNTIFRSHRERVSFRDYLTPYLTRNKTFAVFSLYDPMPFVKQTFNLPRLLGKSTAPRITKRDKWEIKDKYQTQTPMDTSFFLKETAADTVTHDFLTRDMQAARLSPKFRMYYRLRPFIPLGLRHRLQKGRKVKVDEGWYLPTEFMGSLVRAVQKHGEPLTIIHPWPAGATFAFVLTHDVETREGFQHIDKLARLEEELGFRSSWNIVPHKYKIDAGTLRALRSRGHEIGIHGYNHDGKLFLSQKRFRQRANAINAAIHNYEAVGFRAPMVHRNLKWLQHLDIQYDASCFDIDPYQPMPGGVGSIWPFICGRFVELPYTLPQDHTLFIAIGERDCRIWKDKLDYIARNSGMALMLTHPDYLNTDKHLDLYRQFLLAVQHAGGYWHALPSEVASWWRQRETSTIEGARDDNLSIQGPAADTGVGGIVTSQDGELLIRALT